MRLSKEKDIQGHFRENYVVYISDVWEVNKKPSTNLQALEKDVLRRICGVYRKKLNTYKSHYKRKDETGKRYHR